MSEDKTGEKLFEVVRQILSDLLGVDSSQIKQSSELIGDLNASGEEIEEIISQIENHYQVFLTTSPNQVKTVQDLITSLADSLNEF